MVEPRKALESMVRYLSNHPDELSRMVRSGLGMRIGVPMAALKWLLTELTKDAGLDAQLDVDPPGLHFETNLERMQTPMRVAANLYVQNIEIDERQMRVDLRVENLNIQILGEQKTQLSALIKSGALNLSRPGDLIKELPDVPPVIVYAEGTRIGLDLMKVERFNQSFYRDLVGLISSLITIKDVRTEKSAHLDVSLRTLPRGPLEASRAFRSAVVSPGVNQARRAASRILRRSPARYLLSGPPR